MPGNLKRVELQNFIRDGAISYWHQTGAARMGRDATSVVDDELRVYGLKNLRIADASIMPRVTTDNTMAACVVIGEHAAEMLKIAHLRSRYRRDTCRHSPVVGTAHLYLAISCGSAPANRQYA
jgi:choline dehydrogenase-like flavoprotein